MLTLMVAAIANTRINQPWLSTYIYEFLQFSRPPQEANNLVHFTDRESRIREVK